MKIFRHKLNFRHFILIFFQLIIIKLSFATSVDSIVSNDQSAVSSPTSSLSETLEFSDSIPGFEQHEFQSQRIKPLNTDKLNYNKSNNNKSNTITKVTTSATLAATLLKKIGLPSSSSTSKYNLSNNNNKTILNSVLIKRTNRPTTATLISSNNNLQTTTPVTFDENDVLKRQFHKLSSTNNKILRLSKKKKAKQSIYKSLNSSTSLLTTTTTTISPLLNDIEEENEFKSSSLAPNNAIATEQHSVIINHGAGAVSTIRRTLNSNRQPSYEHVQIGYPPIQNNNNNNNPFGNDMFSNFPNINMDFTPPPIPQPIKDENLNNNHNNYNLNQQPPSQPTLQSPPPLSPKIIQTPPPPPPLPHNDQTLPPIYPNRNGRLRGAHKKLLRKSALIKENNDINQIVPVSVGIPNTFQNVKPAELPNFAELSFFGYRNEQNAPRSFNEREHYNTNNNFDKPPPSTTFNHNNNNQYNTAINQSPPPPPPPQDFNFNIHPFFSNERRNQPNNNDMYQFFDSPFIPMNNPPPAIHNLNNIHMHHGDNPNINPWIHHSNNINQPNTQNNQFFQRRKLTLNNGNQLNEISNNNLNYGYSSYNAYKGDEEAGIKWPKIFKFTDGRVNLNDFEKEKKLGKIEFGKSVAEDGNEYTFEHVRRDLFLILHGGSFNY